MRNTLNRGLFFSVVSVVKLVFWFSENQKWVYYDEIALILQLSDCSFMLLVFAIFILQVYMNNIKLWKTKLISFYLFDFLNYFSRIYEAYTQDIVYIFLWQKPHDSACATTFPSEIKVSDRINLQDTIWDMTSNLKFTSL
jgi:hypothetical protein